MTFNEFWKNQSFELPHFEKAQKLTRDELTRAREIIRRHYGELDWPATRVINRISTALGIDEYRAKRVFDTESKRMDTIETRRLGEEIGFSSYKVILSPNACVLCRQKTNNGNRVFSQAQVEKTGYGAFVPWHPNCFCLAVPYVR